MTRCCGGPSSRHLEVSDFLEEIGGDATLLVRRSKTDGEGRGERLYLACDTVVLVRAWLDRCGIGDGRLFRSVGKGGGLGEGLDPSQVPRIFKGMAREAGLPAVVVQGLSGHSARVGAAQDMIAAGIELPGDPPCRAVEVDRHGQPLRRAAIGAAKRGGAIGEDSGTGMSGARSVRVGRARYNGGASGAGCGGEFGGPNPARAGLTGANPENVIRSKNRRGRRVRHPADIASSWPARPGKEPAIQRSCGKLKAESCTLMRVRRATGINWILTRLLPITTVIGSKTAPERPLRMALDTRYFPPFPDTSLVPKAKEHRVAAMLPANSIAASLFAVPATVPAVPRRQNRGWTQRATGPAGAPRYRMRA